MCEFKFACCLLLSQITFTKQQLFSKLHVNVKLINNENLQTTTF